MIPLGEILGKLRTEMHLSQKQLAKKVGVSSSMIALYETGSRFPSLPVLIELSRVLGVSTDRLLGVSARQEKFLDVSDLTHQQIISLQLVIENYRHLNQRPAEIDGDYFQN